VYYIHTNIHKYIHTSANGATRFALPRRTNMAGHQVTLCNAQYRRAAVSNDSVAAVSAIRGFSCPWFTATLIKLEN
jgi:hypothetical protein